MVARSCNTGNTLNQICQQNEGEQVVNKQQVSFWSAYNSLVQSQQHVNYNEVVYKAFCSSNYQLCCS